MSNKILKEFLYERYFIKLSKLILNDVMLKHFVLSNTKLLIKINTRLKLSPPVRIRTFQSQNPVQIKKAIPLLIDQDIVITFQTLENVFLKNEQGGHVSFYMKMRQCVKEG